MARTTAPLLGFEASGAIAKTMVYGKWRGVRYARRYVVPGNPQSTEQTKTRTVFAVLREMWKLNPGIGKEPWDSFAKGRPFLGLNSYIGENMRVLRTPVLMTAFIGSPGSKGGIPAASIVMAAGAASGEVKATFVMPTIPTGWSYVTCQAVAFPDQDPHSDFAGPLVAGEVANPTLVVTLAGLGSAVSCIMAGWIEWLKPNGETAYSVGVTDTVTSTV